MGAMISAVVFGGLSLGGCPTDTGTPPGDDLEDQILDILERELDARGTIGPQGNQGIQGEQGSQGETGPAGPAGATGSQGAPGPQGTQGTQGDPGMDGADGQLRIYGDGSSGSKTIAADTTLIGLNTQYENFTINAGFTLTIPSGAVIRCTGTFTNNGTIVIESAAAGALQTANASSAITVNYSPPNPGISQRSASNGEFGDATSTRNGGSGGVGLSEFEARRVLSPGVNAGGGSGGAFASAGAAGGGSLTVLAMGAITNSGTITADGDDGAGSRDGGAGGGVVILASPTSVTNTGTVTADGGDGATSDNFAGVGGGGGGGIIHYLSPNITAGTETAAGGTAGAPGAAGSVSLVPHQGGGGGGASGGDGGAGGSVNAVNTPNNGSNGTAGHVLMTVVDPTALF
jgi:hypothetical protein